MNMIFDVCLHQDKVGTVLLKKQGLYYQLECFCNIPMKNRYNLILMCDDEINLGICVPYQNGFGLRTRMKMSAIKPDRIHFKLTSENEAQRVEFYPVYENKSFEHIDKLGDSCLRIQEKQIGIMFRN